MRRAFSFWFVMVLVTLIAPPVQAAVLFGTSSAETITGTSTADVIFPRGGADFVTAGRGSDIINLGSEPIPVGSLCVLIGSDPFFAGGDPFAAENDIINVGPGVGQVALQGDGGQDLLNSRRSSTIPGYAAIRAGQTQTDVPDNDLFVLNSLPQELIYQLANGACTRAGKDNIIGVSPANLRVWIGYEDFNVDGPEDLVFSSTSPLCGGGVLVTWPGLTATEGLCFIGVSAAALENNTDWRFQSFFLRGTPDCTGLDDLSSSSSFSFAASTSGMEDIVPTGLAGACWDQGNLVPCNN